MSSVQTPVATKRFIVIGMPSKTHVRSSGEIDRNIVALQHNYLVSTPTSAPVPAPTDRAHMLYSTWESLEGLYELEENWNGYDVAAPDPDAIEQAKKWIQCLYEETRSEGHRWISPHVTANEEGSAVFEWARHKKRLMVCVSPSDAIYIKSWGPSVVSEMTDGEAVSLEARLRLWTWLLVQ